MKKSSEGPMTRASQTPAGRKKEREKARRIGQANLSNLRISDARQAVADAYTSAKEAVDLYSMGRLISAQKILADTYVGVGDD